MVTILHGGSVCAGCVGGQVVTFALLYGEQIFYGKEQFHRSGNNHIIFSKC